MNTTLATLNDIASDLEAMLCESGGLIDSVTVRDDRERLTCRANGYTITIRIYDHEERPLINCRHKIDAAISLQATHALPSETEAYVQVSGASELVLVAIIEGLAYEAQAIA